MMQHDVDVAILGSGFGGSLTALLLQRVGLRAVLIDRASHPRFAIGESSTPIADYVLRDIAETYGLPRLAPLCKYGTWQQTYPDLVCGPKRGFSYFLHEPGRPFRPHADHRNELLVAASSSEATADTHWLRSDVDAFLAGEAQAAGVPLLDRCDVAVAPENGGWLLTGTRLEQDVRIRARFLIDATGEAGVLVRTLGIASHADCLTTHSRTLFAHFTGLQPWREQLAASGAAVDDHPFDCDHAALHHLIDEGWMWQLRFNNGVTSAGFMVDSRQHPLDESVPVADEWNRLLDRYPGIARQFETATIVGPPGGLRRSRRLQRLAAQAAGRNWALLPNTAGFIDALHSTGIAQTLCGLERLVGILAAHWDGPSLPAELAGYDEMVRREITLIDKLVSGCYAARRRFRLFVPYAMHYFAGATTYERRRHCRQLAPGAAFLCVDDAEYRRFVEHSWQELQRLTAGGDVGEPQIAAFERTVTDAIRPFNHAGLCNPAARNMYRQTVAP